MAEMSKKNKLYLEIRGSLVALAVMTVVIILVRYWTGQ
jgi:hypothetical protein